MLVSLGIALKFSKHPLQAIFMVALLPVVIEAYNAPFFVNNILTSFL